FCALQLNTNPLRQLAPLVGRIVAEDANGPRVRPPQAGERLDDAGLTGAVGANQAEDLALAHREGHAIDCDLAAVGLPQALHLHDRHPTAPPRRTARRECLPPRGPTARMARQSPRPDRPRSYISDQPQRRAPWRQGLMPESTDRLTRAGPGTARMPDLRVRRTLRSSSSYLGMASASCSSR